MLLNRFKITQVIGTVLAAAFSLGLWAAAPLPLPASPYAVKVDGNPREAFLLGAKPIKMHGIVTGRVDGSVKTYAIVVKKGLYVAVLSTEPDGGRGLLRPFPWTPPAEAVLCDWMAVRVGPPDSAVLFVLGPGNYRGTVDERGKTLGNAGWRGATSIFGRTWAGEWLISWKRLGVRPGGTLRLEALRGRKITRRVGRGRRSQEDRSQLSPGKASGRWGGDGVLFDVTDSFGKAETKARALENFDIRAFVPPGEADDVCRAAAPAGEVVTAWLEAPPCAGKLRVSVGPGLEDVRVFRLDFWWQAGRRVQVDALFPSQVAAGLGDVFVGERFFPQPRGGFSGDGCPLRVYIRGRIPRGAFKRGGRLEIPVRISAGDRPEQELTWKIDAAPPLPRLIRRTAGVYYIERDSKYWSADLADIAAHGVREVTCPARDSVGWSKFQSLAAKYGLDGAWALHPDCVPPGAKAWGYVTDEPATREAIAAARIKAARQHARGLQTWAALAWPNSLALDDALDGIAVPPGLEGEAPSLKSAKRWVYFQGLREDPFYNRVWASLLSRAPGLDGFWVFCYAPGARRPVNDWYRPIIRYDALVDPDGKGGRYQTVQWEALREGVIDGRLIDALGPRAKGVLACFPGALDAMQGRYWMARNRGWSFEDLREALVKAWREKADKNKR